MVTSQIDEQISSLGKCVTCGTTYRYDGTTRERNGLVCICLTKTVTNFVGVDRKLRSQIRWGKVVARVTLTPCDAACRSARGPRCDCECGGRQHGLRYLQ